MPFRKVLVAVDGSELATAAVRVAAEIAADLGGELAIVSVFDPLTVMSIEGGPTALDLVGILRDDARRSVDEAAKEAAACPPVERMVREGRPGTEIRTAAEEWKADLIAIGTHGRGGLTRLLLGSTAESVVRHAPCPVLVVPESARASPPR
jgi:nucleotide-binding universal stress UspA family protein